MRPLIIALLPLAGCTAWIPSGDAKLCLDGPAEFTWEDTHILVSGAVESFDEHSGEFDPIDCFNGPTHSVQIRDTDDGLWSFGYSVVFGDGEDVTPTLDLEVGETVNLDFSIISGFGFSSGAVLADADGVVYAADQGVWGFAVPDGDVPGLSIDSGSVVAKQSDTCGQQRQSEIVFEADESVAVSPGNQAPLALGGTDYTAFALANMDWSGTMRCTDLSGARTWAIAR